jgi:hypothetical protein
MNCFEFSSHMSWIVFILLLKNEENIKGWLSRPDFKFNETFFICKCSNVSSLNINRYPLFYQKSIQEWTKFLQCVQKVETKTDILHVRLFGNCNKLETAKPNALFYVIKYSQPAPWHIFFYIDLWWLSVKMFWNIS